MEVKKAYYFFTYSCTLICGNYYGKMQRLNNQATRNVLNRKMHIKEIRI